MSYSQNLIDFNIYANDFTDSDVDSPITQLNVTDTLTWPDKQGNLDASPILDSTEWVGFTTDNGGVTKLVSSEEDLISMSGCNTPLDTDKTIHTKTDYLLDDWENNLLNNNHHNNNREMDNSADGFAFNEVITIGEYTNDDDSASSPGSLNRTMADRWSSDNYDTVLRINNACDKKNLSLKGENGVGRKVDSRKKDNSVSSDENMCSSCNERVYITEKLVIDHLLYHQKCFKCTKCKRILNMNNFAANCGRLFCKPHFLEMFRQKGNYDEIDFIPKENSDHTNEDIDPQHVTANTINDNTQTDELPPPKITKNIVEKFRQLESAAGIESLLPRHLSSGQQNMKSTTVCAEINGPEDESVTNDILDELPTPGITKNLLSLWSSLESKSLYSSASSACGTPKNANKSISLFNDASALVDIVRHDDHIEDSYPLPNTTKSLAAKFNGEAPIIPQQPNNKIIRTSSLNRTANMHHITPGVDIVSSSTPNDDWLQCRLSGVDQGSENKPIRRDDVLRSESLAYADELPELGATRHLIGLFRSMEAK